MRHPTWIWLTLLVSALSASVSFAQTWPNEPAGSTLLLNCNFTSATCSGALEVVGGVPATTTDATAPSSPSVVLRNTLPGLATGGGWQQGIYGMTPHQEFYFGLDVKMSSGFEGFPSNFQKLLFVNANKSGQEVFYYFGVYGSDQSTGGQFTLFFETNVESSIVDNSHLPNTLGGLVHWGNSCTFSRGSWHKLEAYIKASTTATSRDGTFRWWLDNQLCGNYTNANYPGGVMAWDINHTWDGGTPNTGFKTRSWDWDFDHVKISLPAGGGPPPPPDTSPPNPPTNLTVR